MRGIDAKWCGFLLQFPPSSERYNGVKTLLIEFLERDYAVVIMLFLEQVNSAGDGAILPEESPDGFYS